MGNKNEIIIDDVNVAECELFIPDNRCFAAQKQGLNNPKHKDGWCKYNHNCYFKQLKRLKKQIFDIKEYCSYHRIDRILDTLDGEPLEINNYVANYILNEILENQ